MSEDNKIFSTQYYNYDLPVQKIAPKPAEQRIDSKLLKIDKNEGNIVDSKFKDLSEFLKEGDLLIFNDSRVIKARLFGKKESGGKVEVFLIRPHDETDSSENSKNNWIALVNPSKAIKVDKIFNFANGYSKVIKRLENGQAILKFFGDDNFDFSKFLEKTGEIPLPPYIQRRRELKDYTDKPFDEDSIRYQTVYAQDKGSVAAPTAGLHFDESHMQKLKGIGGQFAYVTLHVGLGTFKPVKSDDIREHSMEREWYSVSEENYNEILRAKKEGRRVIAVGTTSVRVAESVFKGEKATLAGWTDLFIYPGFDFKVVDAMITNFHLPGSTLILLVSALAGRNNILNAYEFAKNNEYRFYSYGDAMLII